MLQKQAVKTQVRQEVRELGRQVRSLRSLLISLLGQDSDGRYRPEFVKEALSAAQEKPEKKFTDIDSFLLSLKKI
ncbi:MAG: hypothetical protein WC862_00020 [Patescibacteria group bacterium]